MSDESPPSVDSSVPDEVREILAHSLVRDPDERFATAGAMRRALENAIDRLGLDATTEDVAEWLRDNFVELNARRKEIMAKAVATADARPQNPSLADGEEVAFAPTIVSQREPKTRIDSGVTPLKKREPPPPMDQRTSAKMLLEGKGRSRDESKATLAATLGDIEPAGVPKGRAGLWIFFLFVAAGAAAWFVWPGQARIKALIGREPAAVTTSPPPPPTISASASASIEFPAASASASASASSGHPTGSVRPPTTGTATGSATQDPTASVTASASALPPPPPPPSATDDTPY